MVSDRWVRFILVAAMVVAMIPVVPVVAMAQTVDYPLCADGASQYSPKIDGDRAIWVDERNRDLGGSWNTDIYMYDFGSGLESQLTSSTDEQSDAEISGDWVAYYETTGSYGESAIKALNVVTGESVDVWVGYSGWFQRPKTDGDIIVWESKQIDDPDGFDVMGYDLNTRTPFLVAGGGGDQRFPQVGGGKVIYVSGGTWYSYDLATTITSELTEMPSGVSVTSTAADAQHMIFVANADEITYYLFALDLAASTVETLTTSVEPYPGDYTMDVDGDTVVFAAEPPGPHFKSYVYSMSEGTDHVLSSDDSEQFQPAVSGSTIVWRDGRNYPGAGSNYYDIYTNREIAGAVSPVSWASGIPDGWSAEPVTVTLDATPTAGTTVYYSIDGDTAQVYSDPLEFNQTGQFELTYWATSVWGTEDAHLATIKVDVSGPTLESDLSKDAYAGSATINLSALDEQSGLNAVYWSLDGSLYRQGLKVVSSSIGTHTLRAYAIDNVGNRSSTLENSFTILANATKDSTPIEGTDRYKTAIDAALEAYPDGIEGADYEGYKTVVVATGDNWPDALGAASLAGALGGPILLTKTGSLPAAVATEIGRLGADRAIIVGGEGAVSAGVMSAIDGLAGITEVERIGGADRYATARNVAARAVEAQGDRYGGEAMVTTGLNFPDALAASPVAAHTGWPIYLMGRASSDIATADQMSLDGATGHVYLLGGTGALPDSVKTTIVTRAGVDPTDIERLDGLNRYETAARIAQTGIDDAGLAWDGVALATGENFPDALAGGVMQGRLGSVVLLTPSNSLHASVAAKLTANKAVIDELRYLGGFGALSQAARTAAQQLIQ